MGGLCLDRWSVVQPGVQPGVVPPLDPGRGGILHLGQGLQRFLMEGAGADALGLVEADGVPACSRPQVAIRRQVSTSSVCSLLIACQPTIGWAKTSMIEAT